LKVYPNAEVVLAIPSLNMERRREIVAMCSKLPCQFRIMPDALLIMEHGSNFSAMVRSVKIEDLLSRTTVSFSKDELDHFIRGKTILITGGGGSIGSELCRQVAGAGAKKLVIFDINENDSYILFRELKHLFGDRIYIDVEIGDMTDKERLATVFMRHRPDVVFHAAAHKHVPLMENASYEAVRNNIFGTFNVLQMVKKYSVPKFVLISTDKAVNPTSVMGATKRYCELMCRAMACEPGCSSDYIAVRFGNVLGSHGSVLPIFQLQLAHGGPITVTDKRITRYFMTIPEAAGLVIKAAAMAERSDTYILDMGKPVNMWELAENFVRLSGYEPYKEINIIETGLRPGEKLYEELLVNDEVHKSTSISRIFVEKNSEFVKMEDILAGLDMLRRAMATGSDKSVVNVLRELVPTFKTPEEVNSKFENGNFSEASLPEESRKEVQRTAGFAAM
jgi:FlaA1/EpsC-like NDP-sugar epimerase